MAMTNVSVPILELSARLRSNFLSLSVDQSRDLLQNSKQFLLELLNNPIVKPENSSTPLPPPIHLNEYSLFQTSEPEPIQQFSPPSIPTPPRIFFTTATTTFPRHRHIHHSIQKRTYFSRRLSSLESSANSPENAINPESQAEFYRQLLKQGLTKDLIQRFEEQPQVSSTLQKKSIQSDLECLRLYALALAQEGRVDELVEKVLSISASASGTSSTSSNFKSAVKKRVVPEAYGEPRAHWLQMNKDVWNQAVAKSGQGQQQHRYQNDGGNGDNGSTTPVQVIISEAWSWGKFSRKVISSVVTGIVIITGLSVLLDQYGVLKPGMSLEINANQNKDQLVKFADVQGVDEAKQELEEVVLFLREPDQFLRVGGKLPKGILLYGPPGTGKTHLARAVAGEAGVPFFQMSGSEFDEMYVGVGAKRMRELFAAARAKAPCIVFIDEIDAVGTKRNARDQSHMRQTLNQLLVELDGFSSTSGVIFIAATNQVESLDKALLRPGRFDRHVAVPLPDVIGRTRILQVHSRDVKLAPEVDLSLISRGTPGFSGADLSNLINQAAIRASKLGLRAIRNEELEWAKDKIIMGSELKSKAISPESKELTAYHEGGHSIIAMYTPGAMPLHKVTVIPRGNALGVTVQLPEGDVTSVTRKELLARLDVCLGGRIAEEMIFGKEEVTTGASNDFEHANNIARQMVTRYGMSEKIGLICMSPEELEKASSKIKSDVEAEVKELLEASRVRATKLLNSKKEELHRLAKALIIHETLNADDVKKVVQGIEIQKDKELVAVSRSNNNNSSSSSNNSNNAPKNDKVIVGTSGVWKS
ncbi:hypothetical protein HK098_003457 [Nowakowskiella sp. JEL0407]|nr:hypothetical protein HK098_003457 [Nowakowskiella sp. JEL0407]